MDRLRRQRAAVFALTWLSYASYYLCRKGLSVAKSPLADEFHLGMGTLAAIDTGYLVGYAAGQFASGLLSDALGSRRVLGAGMLVSAAACAWFGMGAGPTVFAVAFALNGLAQSTGWSGNVKAMTAWTPPAERGLVMGLWSTCYQVGGLVATWLATLMLTHYGWRMAFFVPAAWVAAVGIAVLLLLRDIPPGVSVASAHRATSRAVLRDPRVWNLGAAYFALKLIRYSLLFWLPFYLHRALGYSTGNAGYLSLSFEVGGVLGSVSAGLLSDRTRGRRGPVLVAACVGLALALWLYARVAPLGALANFGAMALVGAMLFGPDSLTSATAAQDVGGRDGAATAAGVINGVGSVGAVVQGALTSYVAARYGWGRLFEVFIGLALAAALVLVPFALAESRGKAVSTAP